jgi:cell wall assembly regulator SMI1
MSASRLVGRVRLYGRRTRGSDALQSGPIRSKVRSLSERDAMRVDDAWSEITGHLERRCPDVARQVRAPATPEWLRRAEEAVGGQLPADLTRWWRLADGMDGHTRLIPHLHTPLSIGAALSSRLTWLEVSAENTHDDTGSDGAAGSPVYGVWLPQWLPIASDQGGSELFVDLRPGPARGCVGEFYSDGWEFRAPRWGSVAAMLSDVAAAFGSDDPVHGFRIWIDEEGIAWDHPQWRWARGGSSPTDPDRLRQRYRDLVAELRSGGFATTPDDGWSAEKVAAHVKRSTELLMAVTDAIDATGLEFDRQMARVWSTARRRRHANGEDGDRVEPYICYDNSETFDPAVLDRYAVAGLSVLADDIERLSERLAESVGRIRGRRPIVYVHIVDGEALLDTAVEGWFGILWAVCLRQLPIRIRQLRALRRPGVMWIPLHGGGPSWPMLSGHLRPLRRHLRVTPAGAGPVGGRLARRGQHRRGI